jgi:neutral ceramidase
MPYLKVAVPVVLIRLGDIALVGVQPELAAGIGVQIKAGSPFAGTMVATMVDGSAKYMPDAQSYDRFTTRLAARPLPRAPRKRRPPGSSAISNG